MPSFVHYIPIATTIISAMFSVVLWRHWRSKPQARYLYWWFVGVAMYGVGTLTESLTTLAGWHSVTFKGWYIAGALLGSYLGASFGIRRGNRFLRIMFLGTAAVTGAILLWPWLRALLA